MKTKTEPEQTGRFEGEAIDRKRFRRALLEWFDDHRRALPWRGVDDPYAVWVSEVMLQQTRVSTVIDYFERWMEQFPTVYSLAEASIEEVLELWSGLGYYRRARYLHRAARQVVDQWDGKLPQTVSGLEELPGVGPYTAGAIASIAFEQVEPVVDGNVMRVISRLEAIEGDPRGAPANERIWEAAGRWVDPDRPGDFNQAMMELGSEVCTTQSPACDRCPVQACCRGWTEGQPQRYPTGSRTTKQRPLRGRCCVVWHDDGTGDKKFLLRRRPEQGLLAGLWEFPSCECQGRSWPSVETLKKRLITEAGLDGAEVAIDEPVGTVGHVFSHRRLKMKVHHLEIDEHSADREGRQRWRWVGDEQLSEVASSALLTKVYRRWSDQR